MLQKVHDWITTINTSLAALPLQEHKVVALGVGALALVCLVMPVMMVMVFRFVGVCAALACAYLFWQVCEREDEDAGRD